MTDATPYETPSTGKDDPIRSQAEAAREKLGEAKHAIADEARSFAESAKVKAQDEAQARTAQISSAMGDFAAAMRKAGDELGERDQTFAAKLIGQAVDGIEALSGNLGDKKPEEMLHMVRDFGRNNPTAFVAASVLAGFALGRFARSSAQHSHGADGFGQGAADTSHEMTSPTASTATPSATEPSFSSTTDGLEGSALESSAGAGLDPVTPQPLASGDLRAEDGAGLGSGVDEGDDADTTGRSGSDPIRGL